MWGIAPGKFLDAVRGKNVATLEQELEEGARVLGEGRPSFLQDVMRGRRTEIGQLNGYVVERGREVEVPTPANAAVVKAVHSFAVGELHPDPSNLGLLSELLEDS